MSKEIKGWVVVTAMDEDIEQLSIWFNSYEKAEEFKNTEYNLKEHPYSYIIGRY